MASGMSNFNIKKSFVWKYGLSKLHKKKEAEEADGSSEPRMADEDVTGPLEPDLDLRPQWEPPLAGDDPEVPQKRRGGPLVPAVHAPAATRTMDTAVSQYIRVVAQMQGYDVAGCRSVLRDGVVPFPKPETEPPIYETLGEFQHGDDSGATIAEDQQTLYENDDTDDELSAPLYENSTLEQPIYANGMLLEESDEADEAPIYENLGVGETAPSPVPSLPPKPAGVAEPTYGHLEVEVRSDHGYDSYQSPTSSSSDTSGESPAKLSPNSESSGSECGAAQRALVSAETVAASRSGIPPPPPLPPPPPVTTTMVRAKKALGQTVSLPPAGRQSVADRPKLDLPAAREDKPASEIENKLSASFVAQLHDMLQKKTSGIRPDSEPNKAQSTLTAEKSVEKTVERNVEKRRSKTGDTMAFQMARKAVAQALQKGRPQEQPETPKPKLAQSLSVPSDKPDVTAPVERVAVAPGVIPPPPPMPAPAASGAGKLSASLLKMSAPKSLQNDLKKKLEAKKASMQSEKVEPKKKKLVPKPPDRSFSLPGFGNARLDIAKAFEEFKRNEAIKKEEALMKKKKSKYVDKLDLKDYKKPSSNTGEVEEEMFALAAESADAVNSELEQRPPMKSFLSDDPPAPQPEKTAATDRQSTGPMATQKAEPTAAALPTGSSASIPEETDDDEPPALPARSGLLSELPPPPQPAAEESDEQRGQTNFECVPEERAEPLPPRPRPLTKKPQLLQRPVERAAVTPPVATVTPPATATTPCSAAVTTPPVATPPAAVAMPPVAEVTPPPTQTSTPPSRNVTVNSEVTVSGSQVIQICPDGSWGVAERDTGVSADATPPADRCQVEVDTVEHGTSVISTVELVTNESRVSGGTDSGSDESKMSHFSDDEPNKIKLKLGRMEITNRDEPVLKESPDMEESVTDTASYDEEVLSTDTNKNESYNHITEELNKSSDCSLDTNTAHANELVNGQSHTAEHIEDRFNSVQPIAVESLAADSPLTEFNTANVHIDEPKTVDFDPAESATTESATTETNTVEIGSVEPVAVEHCEAESDTVESSTVELEPVEPCLSDPDAVAPCTSEFSTSAEACGGGGPAVTSHPRQMPGHAWAETDRGVGDDCRPESHAQTETDRADGGDSPAEPAADTVREEGDEEEPTEEGGPTGEEEAEEREQKVEKVGDGATETTSEVREGDSDEATVTICEDSITSSDSSPSVNVSTKAEIELKHAALKRQNATELADSDSQSQQTEEDASDTTADSSLVDSAEEAVDSAVTTVGENCPVETDVPAETRVVTAATQSIKLHVSAPESICDGDASEKVAEECEEFPSEPASSTETPGPELLSETDVEGAETEPEEKEDTDSTQEKQKMPLFHASMVEVESAPSSLEDSACKGPDPDEVTTPAPVPAPVPALVPVTAPVMEVASVDDIEAQVAALRSKVLSVNSLSSGGIVPAPIPAPAHSDVPVTRTTQSQPLTPDQNQESAQSRQVWVSEVERQFENLERIGGEETENGVGPTTAEVAEPTPTDEPHQITAAGNDAPAGSVLSTEETDDHVNCDDDSPPQSVESLSIIANKAQTKHFLESRLQENLGEPATPATPLNPDSAAQAGLAPADPPPAKMATHEPISPPPGFDDAADDAAASGSSGSGGGGGEVEGVEFEEFDMDWAPRRPVAPPMRSYMFGEQLGHKPASAPARPPASPSYRDLFTADEAASSTASVTSAVSLDEARQDSACGTSEPDETDEAVSGGAETMIAQEIRELRRREEELRRLREKTLAVPAAPEPPGEEPLSGYGSEERESFTEEPPCPSRLLPCDRAVSHQRSRSADSLSSGHSSSGLGSDTGDLLARRRVTVKPFEETDDDERWSYPRSAETPIEREIRLAKEREDERRREQAMFTSRHTMAAVFEEKPSTRTSAERPAPSPAGTPAGLANDPREAALRLATGRVQEEIQEATRREIELRDEGKDITTSEETVDEKVTRLVDMTKHSVELTNDKKQRADQARSSPTVAKPSPGPKPTVKPVHIVPRPAPEPARPAAAAPVAAAPITSPAAGGLKTDVTPRPVFRPAVAAGAGRGLMHKFIASRGRLRPVSVFSPAPSGAGARELSPPRSRRPAPPQLSVAAASRTEQTTERRGPVQVPSRRVLTAEAKIQLELQAMKEREEELRRHRSRMMAKSQPDLLAALGDMAPSQEEGDDDPAPGPLSRAMSNPNLLDDGPTETTIASANRRRRSTLIDQWESRIQGAEV